MEVPILDIRGSLSGANSWRGLVEAALEANLRIRKEALYSKHECSLCCTVINFEGQQIQVRAATADGLTATRYRKCSRHGCTNDLIDMRPQTRCSVY